MPTPSDDDGLDETAIALLVDTRALHVSEDAPADAVELAVTDAVAGDETRRSLEHLGRKAIVAPDHGGRLVHEVERRAEVAVPEGRRHLQGI